MKRVNRNLGVCASFGLVIGALGVTGCGSGDDPVSMITVNSTVFGADGSTGVSNGTVVFNICVMNNGQTLCNSMPGYSNVSFPVDASGNAPNSSVAVPSNSLINLSIDASSALTVTTCTATYVDNDGVACKAKSVATGPLPSSATQSACLAKPVDNRDGTFSVVVSASFTIPDYVVADQACEPTGSTGIPSGGSSGSNPDAGAGPTAFLDLFNSKPHDSRARGYDGKLKDSDDSGSGSGPRSVAGKASA